MKVDMNNPRNLVLAGGSIISLLLIVPNLGKGLDGVAYLIKVPSIAYAAKDTADGVDHRFDQYIQQQQQAIETQNKIAEAIAGYTQQQQQQQNAMQPLPHHPGPIQEYDPSGVLWCCQTTREQCWDEHTWYREGCQ